MTRKVTYSMGMSLDGYIVGPDGGFQWTAPDDELFRFAMDQIREVGVHLMGRHLYEAMLHWENVAGGPGLSDAEREWISLWNPLPKLVFSRTLTTLRGNARLATGSLREEITRLRAAPEAGNIAIGGATLATAAAADDLVDEYRPKIHPVLVGGGTPFFPHHERRVDLELLETRTFPTGVTYLRQRVLRASG
ncbi:dihydrofolate reductase family protein [Streptomyces sp. NPDC060194]|uniref:dihydrofolate reductase family protein n=1 Tax=Streptomyces sp. NPDC060194 TaxID=3347069 RepID=UPI00364E93F1